MTYRVVVHDSAADFLGRAEAWLLDEEDRHSVFLSLAYGLAGRKGPLDGVFFGTAEDEGAVVGCIIRTPPHKALVTEMPLEAAAAAGRALADVYDDLPAVLGAGPVAEAVATEWSDVHGGQVRPGLEQRIYRLDSVVPSQGAPGGLRVGTGSDVDRTVRWSRAFADDAGPQFMAAPDAIQRWVDQGQLFLWEDAGEPVCMTVAQGRTPNAVRIGYVFTPRELRGRGYASACVAAVSQRMLSTGCSFCVLYADLSNPTSNAMYMRLGYEPVTDVRDVDIVRNDED